MLRRFRYLKLFMLFAAIALWPLADWRGSCFAQSTRNVDAITTPNADSPKADKSQPVILFETHVEAIFQQKCHRCHNKKTRKSDLDLSTPTGVLNGSESGRVIVAGKPDESILFQLIEDGSMPPDDKEQLTTKQIQTIQQWISAGARFRDPNVGQQTITQNDVIPIMLLRCTACHGTRRKEAGLDLRTKASMLKGGKSGPAVVSGQPEASLLIKRIVAEEMPPRRQLVSVSVKPMESTELELLKKWIKLGLPEAAEHSDTVKADTDPLVKKEDRQFWAFQIPRSAVVPSVKAITRVRNPIDAFMLEKLEKAGLSLSDDAEKLTLMRRVYFDLTGLPPRPEEVEAFLNDDDPLVYENLIDRLLASPRYGERWGRHWLDVAGYADSEGAQNQDKVRPHMYRYRDYVIRSFNADKPYDRFLHEQLAGDELADYTQADVITEELYDNLVATGFLRTAPDRTFANITNFVPDRLEVIADEIQILGTSVMGLTINCARCHSHKFDPIPQRDYYRLLAVFKDGYDEHDWLKSQGPRTLKFVTTPERQRWEKAEAILNKQIEPLKKQLAAEKDMEKKKPIEEQIKTLKSKRPTEPRIRALWSRGEPSPTYILKRGNYLTPGREIGPGVPSALTNGHVEFDPKPPWPGAKKTGRRLAFARWLTNPNHPLTARVMVNRIWKHHFGTGIVRTLDNFGKAGERPSHPELLDWLAVQFVRHGWSIKTMHRLILTSSTYRQSSKMRNGHLKSDPDGRLLSRMPLKRMEAEVLRDSLLFVSDRLDETPFGPADAVNARSDGLVTSVETKRGRRRSIYVLQRRTQLPTLLENFDFPQMGPNCIERDESIVAPQALHLMNNLMVHQLAGQFSQRVRQEASTDLQAQIERIYLIALSRRPTQDEINIGMGTLEQFTLKWAAEFAKNPAKGNSKDAAAMAIHNFCHAIMNSAAFLYID